MRAEAESHPDWRDGAAYQPLLGADRSLFAWEWLRRDPRYRAAACPRGGRGLGDPHHFGLVAFEPAGLSVPAARPLWSRDASPFVLAARRSDLRAAGDRFDPFAHRASVRMVASGSAEHLLLSDGLRCIRLDVPGGTFADGPAALAYRLEGLLSAGAPLVTLRRFLAFSRFGRFSPALHPRETKASRWVLMLRASDALAAGAGQREIAAVLLSRSAGEPRWRDREPSTRLRAQRLVRSARLAAAGGYRLLLR